jgi:hypothetical protein
MAAASPGSSRREFLTTGASLTGLGVYGLLGGQGAQPPAGSADGAAQRLDAGLERVQSSYPSTNFHRDNHAPMVVEALSVLGRADAIAPWLDVHHHPCAPDTAPGARIDAERWRESLAQGQRFSDWRALFQAELQGDDWRAVLLRWVPRFVPGLAGSATHGLIRTAHGARALAAHDSEVRRRELATGLAYWAVSYEELPWDGSLAPEPSVAAALARVQPRQPALAPPHGNIIAGLRALGETPSFLPVAGLIDPSDPERVLREMASACARLYLRNPDRRIAFAHTVTAPSALRLLAPYLDDGTVIQGVRYAWQAAAGLYVVYGDPRLPAPAERAAATRDALVTAAVLNGGSHSIKLTEACLREDALSHDPALIQAAQDAGEGMRG